MDKKKWAYVGIGLFCLLVIINSTKKEKEVELNPVPISEVDESNTKSFDNAALPLYLKPPTRLKEGDNLPKLNVPKRVLGFTLGGTKQNQRFDIL
jgi:hypothetical protein